MRSKFSRTAIAGMCLVIDIAIVGAQSACGASCIGEGGEASGKTFTYCCEGLTRSDPIMNEVTCDRAPDYVMCTQCGNGVCGAGENLCNCPEDCKKK